MDILYNKIYNLPDREKALQGLALKIIVNRMIGNRVEENKAQTLYNRILCMENKAYLEYKKEKNE